MENATLSVNEIELARRLSLAGLLDVAEDGIVTVDADQRIVLFNRGAETIFGYERADVLGRALDILIPQRFVPAHRTQVDDFARSDAVARHMGERSEVYGRRRDGSEFPADISISKFASEGRMFMTAVVRDVTERHRAQLEILELNSRLERRVAERTAELEQANSHLRQAVVDLESKTEELRSITAQLWQAAKLASVGELAASIAHELNNPLGIVSLRLEGVLAKTPVDDPRRKALDIIDQELERMSGLVSNLLHFSRPGREVASSVDLGQEIARTLELMHHHLRKRGVEVTRDVDPGSVYILADRQKLRQVLLNLISNAGDAMEAGGILKLTVRHCTMECGQAGVLIEVADTGHGIAPELLPKVMEPFFTTKEEGKGTGLGLAICRRIVNEHRGSIRIESEQGKGTTVRILMPASNGINVTGLKTPPAARSNITSGEGTA